MASQSICTKLGRGFGQDESETDLDVESVVEALGLGGQGGQRDPDFDVKIARPTFTNLRPKVAIDEAHNNFHTAEGRYKPFADLMANDGCLVSRNTGTLNSQTLDRYDILVIANAIGSQRGSERRRARVRPSRRMNVRPSRGGSGLAGRFS